MRVCESRDLRKIFGSKMDEIIGNCVMWNFITLVGFEVFTAATMKNAVF
jgi:hypothetical protein